MAVVDERLDVQKETRAAMELLSDLFDLFQDWRFAIKAYNEGEDRVQGLIDKYGSRDPWQLEIQEEGPEQYLSQVMALMIILKNPSLLN